jgi:serine/threonine-protein kinase
MAETRDAVSADEALAERLLRWQELREQGRAAGAEQLCADRPELAGALGQRIRALLAMEAALGVGDETPRAADATPPPVPGPSAPTELSLPGYEVLGVLARGGMGVVYKARNLRLNRLEAVKLMLAGLHATPEGLARFRTEAEAVARLRHPNVVQVYQVGDWAGEPYFTMEYLEGGSLAERLRRAPLPPREAAALVQSLAGAVRHAHERGIVHRDLKPANVLLQDGVPKITDFGLAKLLDRGPGSADRTRTGAVMGTPCYLAPEQAGGRSKEVGPAADVYALGAILYECLSGRPPFEGETTLDTLEQVRRCEPVPPSRLRPRVPRDLENICLQCLRKEPGRRYAGARELADDLGRFLHGRPVLARPVPVWQRGAKWVRRQPALAALLVVSVLAAAALLATWARFTARLADEIDHARSEERRAKEQTEIAKKERADAQKQKTIAEKERTIAWAAHGKAEKEKRRAELILARCEAAIDQHATFSRSSKKELRREGQPGTILYSLARSYAAEVAALARDRDLAPADRARLADRYAARAVHLLDTALADQYFDSADNRRKLKEDAGLNPLRGREDFRRLLERAGR